MEGQPQAATRKKMTTHPNGREEKHISEAHAEN
jgi:hypothetical protein